MKFTKKNFTISSILIILPILFQLGKYRALNWITLSNHLFLIALPLLIIGLFGWVLANETFDFFHYSMRKTRRLRKNKNNHADLNEEKIDPHALSTAVGKSYQSILTIGVLVFIASVLCLWEYIL